MALSEEHRERLKRVALATVPAVLGGMAVKNIRERAETRHVSFWQASGTFLIDLLNEGREGGIRLSGIVHRRSESNPNDIDVELYEGFEFTDEKVARLEKAFLPPAKEE